MTKSEGHLDQFATILRRFLVPAEEFPLNRSLSVFYQQVLEDQGVCVAPVQHLSPSLALLLRLQFENKHFRWLW